jgi:hypothetical protein
MSEIEAMEEYIKVALSLRRDTVVGDMYYEALAGERVMKDLDLELE